MLYQIGFKLLSCKIYIEVVASRTKGVFLILKYSSIFCAFQFILALNCCTRKYGTQGDHHSPLVRSKNQTRPHPGKINSINLTTHLLMEKKYSKFCSYYNLKSINSFTAIYINPVTSIDQLFA